MEMRSLWKIFSFGGKEKPRQLLNSVEFNYLGFLTKLSEEGHLDLKFLVLE